MKRTWLVVVLVSVVATRLAVSQADAPLPSIADMRAALDRGEPQEAIKMSARVMRVQGKGARQDDQYELLMVRGEALMALGLPLDAEDAYEHAVQLARGLKERAAARAEGLVARQSVNLARHPADDGASVQAAARAPARPDPEARRRAMRELYQGLRPKVEAKVHAAVGGKTLPPLYSVLTPLIDLGSLELTADGTLEKSLPLLHELGEWASGITTDELRRIEKDVTAIGAASALGADDRKSLEEMKVTLYRLEPVTREGAQLAELLDDREASKVWKEMSVKTSDLYSRVESLLSRR